MSLIRCAIKDEFQGDLEFVWPSTGLHMHFIVPPESLAEWEMKMVA